MRFRTWLVRAPPPQVRRRASSVLHGSLLCASRLRNRMAVGAHRPAALSALTRAPGWALSASRSAGAVALPGSTSGDMDADANVTEAATLSGASHTLKDVIMVRF